MTAHEEEIRLAAAAMSAAVLGGVLAALLASGWPVPLFDWMRVIQIRSAGAAPTVVQLAAYLTFPTMLLAVVIYGFHMLLRRLGISRPAITLGLVLIVVFMVTFVAEAACQISRASGNLTASDATGFIIDDRRLTAHGWETIARRAVAASLFAGVIAAAFELLRRIDARRSTDP